MLVKIEEIQGVGLERTEPIKAEVLKTALADSEGFALVSSTPLSASFKKVSGRVFVRGGFTAELTCPCKRCTTAVPVPVDVEFSLRMVPEPTAPRSDEPVDPAAVRAKKKPGRSQRKEDDGEAFVAASFELDEID